MKGELVMSEKESFVFYPSWLDAIDAMEKAQGEAVADKFARQIVQYGVTGEFTTDNEVIVGFIKALCADLITKSKNRYRACKENGKRGGRKEEYDRQAIYDLHKEGVSNADIAIQMDCSVRTVERVLKEMREEDEI